MLNVAGPELTRDEGPTPGIDTSSPTGGRDSTVFAFLPSDSGGADVVPRGSERYHLEALNVVRGAGIVDLNVGWSAVRFERSSPWTSRNGALALIGGAEVALSSSPEREEQLLHRWASSPFRVAVLIPFAHDASWWQLAAEDRRRTHLAWEDGSAAEARVCARVSRSVLRRIYRARSTTSNGWDVLAYFEMQPQDVAPFREFLSETRHCRTNPEWGYIARECELWLTRTRVG